MSLSTIVSSSQSCLHSFQKVLQNCKTARSEDVQLQQSQFNIWASNSGVFAPLALSLDTRLSDENNAAFRHSILQLLGVLEDHLRVLYTDKIQEIQSYAVDWKTNELYSENIQAITEIIASLHRLSSTIQRSAVQHKNLEIANFIERDEYGHNISTYFETIAPHYIHKLNPEADKSLCQRLGKSVALRRKRILYNRRQLVKLRNNVQRASFLTEVDIYQGPPANERYNPEIVTPDSGLSKSVPIIQNVPSNGPFSTTASQSDSGNKQFSIRAPSDVSSISTGSLLQDQDTTYPPPPRIKEPNLETSCPYCSAILTKIDLSRPHFWRQHIKRDIEPYTCILENCEAPTIFFDSFKKWLEHTRSHRMQWICPLVSHVPQTYTSKKDLEAHLQNDHKRKWNASQLSGLLKIAAQPSLRPFDECPLCKCGPDIVNEPEGRKVDWLPRHIAGHLKTIAVKFLPGRDDDEELRSVVPFDLGMTRSRKISSDGKRKRKRKKIGRNVARRSDLWVVWC